MGSAVSHLGRRPGVYTRYDVNMKRDVHKVIFGAIQKGLPFETACWFAAVDPEEIREHMAKNEHLRYGFMHQMAIREATLIHEMQEGGRGLSKAKAALETLQTQHRAWAKASTATLEKRLEHALEVLKKKLEPKVYEVVLRTLERFA